MSNSAFEKVTVPPMQYCSVSRSSYFVRPLASTALNVRTQENPYPHPCLPNPGGLSQIWLPQSWGLGGLTERYCLHSQVKDWFNVAIANNLEGIRVSKEALDIIHNYCIILDIL